jgi:hypothetical protein
MIACYKCRTYIKNTGQNLGCQHKPYPHSKRKAKSKGLYEKFQYVGEEEDN